MLNQDLEYDDDESNAEPASLLTNGIRRLVRVAIPLFAFGWLVREVADIWGIYAVLFLCLTIGTVLGFLISSLNGGGIVQTFKASTYGRIPAIIVWLVLAPLLTYCGFEADTGPRKRHEAKLAEVKKVIVWAADLPDLPVDRLILDVRFALNELPNHGDSDWISLNSLAPLLQHPHPMVRAQTALALGQLENLTADVLPLLTPILNDPAPKTRAAALIGISGLRPLPEPAREAISNAMSDDNPVIRHAAEFAAKRNANPTTPSPFSRW